MKPTPIAKQPSLVLDASGTHLIVTKSSRGVFVRALNWNLNFSSACAVYVTGTLLTIRDGEGTTVFSCEAESITGLTTLDDSGDTYRVRFRDSNVRSTT